MPFDALFQFVVFIMKSIIRLLQLFKLLIQVIKLAFDVFGVYGDCELVRLFGFEGFVFFFQFVNFFLVSVCPLIQNHASIFNADCRFVLLALLIFLNGVNVPSCECLR
ncbi:unnamed protein product [Bacillus phage SPP1]|uniref:Bacteriophage SPP1 complete nucleotide sequence n=1 Tax=Bacillus phage SPP1 TaxID=10724 RepID=O48442_BPSPP|nr:hypothetical protein SPP1p016 [Bacillus phage SPP1]CAA66586.1 unnamed protein product [Bacillus phage SPP1]